MGAKYGIKAELTAVDRMTAVTRRVGRNFKQNLGGPINAVRGDVAMLTGRLSRLSAIVGGFGAAAGVGGLLKLASDAETTQLAITTLVQSAEKAVGGKFTKFDSAFEKSTELLANLRKEAATTPGSFEDTANAFRKVVMGVRQAGGSLADATALASNVASQDVLAGGTGVVGADVARALRGGLVTRTPQLAAINKETQALVKAGKKAEALQLITNSLALDPKLRAAFGESFGGKLATVTDQAKEVAKMAAQPLFVGAKGALDDISKWIEKNPDKLQHFATKFGETLLGAVEGMVAGFRWVGDHLDEIKAVAKVVATIWASKRILAFGNGIEQSLRGLKGSITGMDASCGAAGRLSMASKAGGCCCGPGGVGGRGGGKGGTAVVPGGGGKKKRGIQTGGVANMLFAGFAAFESLDMMFETANQAQKEGETAKKAWKTVAGGAADMMVNQANLVDEFKAVTGGGLLEDRLKQAMGTASGMTRNKAVDVFDVLNNLGAVAFHGKDPFGQGTVKFSASDQQALDLFAAANQQIIHGGDESILRQELALALADLDQRRQQQVDRAFNPVGEVLLRFENAPAVMRMVSMKEDGMKIKTSQQRGRSGVGTNEG